MAKERGKWCEGAGQGINWVGGPCVRVGGQPGVDEEMQFLSQAPGTWTRIQWWESPEIMLQDAWKAFCSHKALPN